MVWEIGSSVAEGGRRADSWVEIFLVTDTSMEPILQKQEFSQLISRKFDKLK